MPFLSSKYRQGASRPGVIVLSLLLLFVLPLQAQNSLRQEYQVKGAFLFHFSQFIDWPASAFSTPGDPFVIGILGEDPFGTFLDDLVRGETVNGHPIIVRRYKSPEEISSTHILFITKDLAQSLSQVLALVQNKNMLTVSDMPGFAQQGGMVRFYIASNKIKFQVNVDAAKSNGLLMSSKLLRLADICCSGDD